VSSAFVFINIRLGAETEALKELRRVPEVKESHFVYGVYDVVAKVEAVSLDHLKEVITWKIRRLDNVVSTVTSVVIEGT
jgi:DNA-binding Lrp family transcriptional regulator